MMLHSRRDKPDQALEIDEKARTLASGLLESVRRRIVLETGIPSSEISLSVASLERLDCFRDVATRFRGVIDESPQPGKVRAAGKRDARNMASELLERTFASDDFRIAAERQALLCLRDSERVFWTGPSFSYVASCGFCGGTGWANCEKCDGRGHNPCSACRGTGNNLSGMKAAFDLCPLCLGGGTETCLCCGGKGQIECRHCHGTGKGHDACATPKIIGESRARDRKRDFAIPDSFWSPDSLDSGRREITAHFRARLVRVMIEAGTPAGKVAISALKSLDDGGESFPEIGRILNFHVEAEAERLKADLDSAKDSELPETVERLLASAPRMRAILSGKEKGGRKAGRLRRAIARRCGRMQAAGWLKAWGAALAITIALFPFNPWMESFAAWLDRTPEHPEIPVFPYSSLLAWLVVICAWLAAGIAAERKAKAAAEGSRLEELAGPTFWTSTRMTLLGCLTGSAIFFVANDYAGSLAWLWKQATILGQQCMSFLS